MTRTGAIIQARMGSDRLPGKVLLELPYGSGISVLQQIVERARTAGLDDIIVATTPQASDDALEQACARLGVACFRGPEQDVLARFHQAARLYRLDLIVRLGGDDPCLDSALLADTVQRYGGADYTLTRGYPLGCNIEVFTQAALERAFVETTARAHREHVTPYLYEDPSRFKIQYIDAPADLAVPDARLTLDTEEDYALMCAVFERLEPGFGVRDVVALLQRSPWLRIINRRVEQKAVTTVDCRAS